MMAWTHRYFRAMMRAIAPKARLYTEMITSQAMVLGDIRSPLMFSECEHPIVCQVGGSDPNLLAQSCHIVNQFGYDEVNLNAGCPSPRVSKCNMGAKLMTKPQLLWSCFDAMQQTSDIPVSVKCRLGVDELNDYAFIHRLIKGLAERGCQYITIHARNAWLDGISPKDNRTIPPLNYDRVYQLKQDFPDVWMEINGGFKTVDAVRNALKHVDSVMIGRLCYEDPMQFSAIYHSIYGGQLLGRADIVSAFSSYIEKTCEDFKQYYCHGLYQLYKGTPFSKQWKQKLIKDAPNWNSIVSFAKNADQKILMQ